ncbi:MAG: hypothetical protein JST75_22390 [Bacteroidetes bacterium]|nr:hypothetical protein [Bacteroidota bacterium]
MKKDLLIVLSIFSFFIKHLGKPQQLFYCLSFYNRIDFEMRPGNDYVGAVTKQQLH